MALEESSFGLYFPSSALEVTGLVRAPKGKLTSSNFLLLFPPDSPLALPVLTSFLLLITSG